ncbi:DUF2518 family protein [Anthocerotibacter panamensis]|uniref:DUF2518 family protein n=1 Tax=Anthocerotibacter panamensis TaxID=2857077 RepID=UPI001C405230|nr:DUF2518 family protein [Anthocerotibacter panamensis]
METFQTGAWIALGGTVISALIAVFGYLTKQPWRFKVVGYTGFLLVLTGGLYALGLTPLTRAKVEGAKPYQVVFDRGRSRFVISVQPNIQPDELTVTLRQARERYISSSRRIGGSSDQFEIVARTLVSVEPGTTEIIELGRLRLPVTAPASAPGEVTLDQAGFNRLTCVLAKSPT